MGHCRTVCDSLGHIGTVFDRLKQFRAVLGSLGQFGTVWDIFGQFGTVWDSFGQFWTALDSLCFSFGSTLWILNDPCRQAVAVNHNSLLFWILRRDVFIDVRIFAMIPTVTG